MRVIAGAFRGRRLLAPAGRRIRPTSDKLRETLFNILAAEVRGTRVLDGFAGTGALGIEALSRGAAEVTFVERSRPGVTLITRNLARCGIDAGYTMVHATMREAVDRLSGRCFDLALLDPPYGQGKLDVLLRRVAPLLADGGRLVIEHARRDAMPPAAGPLVRGRLVTSGDSALTFYRLERGTAAAGEEGGDVDN